MNLGAIAHGVADRLDAARDLNAVLAWSRDALLAEARRVESLPPGGALRGVAIAVKDNIVTLDHPTTCGSRMLEGYRSPFEATAVARLRAAGALVAAKTNLDEFAMGSSTEHSAFGRVRHPLDPSRVPGGSSGGSAALVAAGVVQTALGSETGGSVRQPAAFTGTVGVKPTYGRVSRYGLVAFGSSLDCIAVFGATVPDAARVLAVIAGPDRLDSTTVPAPPLQVPPRRDDLRGVTIGVPAEYLPGDLHPGVRAAVDRTIALARELGASVRDVSLPASALAVPAYYVIAPAEAAANLARYDGVRYGLRIEPAGGSVHALYRATRGRGFGAEVRRRILIGTYVLSAGYYDAYYAAAQTARARLAADFTAAFRSGCDFLLSPTTPTPAFAAGEKLDDPVAMYRADVFVCAVSLVGLPAMSLPAGRDEGLPLGVQLIGPWFEDAGMLAVGDLLERHLDRTAEVR